MLGVLMEGRQELKSEYQICHPAPLNYIVFCHNRSLSEVFPNNNNKCEELKNDVAENFDFQLEDNQDTVPTLLWLPKLKIVRLLMSLFIAVQLF